jgi:hypothetical protein
MQQFLLRWLWLALASVAANAQEPAPHTTALATALRAYFAATDARGPELQAVLMLAKPNDEPLLAMLRNKTFLAPHDPVRRCGRLDANHRFVDDRDRANPALFFGPASGGGLRPLFVYVPDYIDTTTVIPELDEHGIGKDRYVFVVPDELRNNQYLSTPAELDRHTKPLRDLLLQHPIDPDRVYTRRGTPACCAVNASPPSTPAMVASFTRAVTR